MTTTERVLMAATPVVTLVGLVGLGYPPYAALTRWRICAYRARELLHTLLILALQVISQKTGPESSAIGRS